MAGTLTISTLSDGTNSTSSTNCIQGSAKAWVNFNGTNGTVRAAYNVSSVTRTSAGLYTANFTSAFADTNYSVCIGGCRTIDYQVDYGFQIQVFTQATGSCSFNTPSTTGSQIDWQRVNLAVFR